MLGSALHARTGHFLDYTLRGVTARTTVGAIAVDARAHLRYRLQQTPAPAPGKHSTSVPMDVCDDDALACDADAMDVCEVVQCAHGRGCSALTGCACPPALPARAPALESVRLASIVRVPGAPASCEVLDNNAPAAAADLFNVQNDLVLICLARGGNLAEALRAASQSAGNSRPKAPEHTRMANNLIAPGAAALPAASGLGGLDVAARRRLRSHLTAVHKLPSRMCYKCGLMDYAQNIPRRRVHDVAVLTDCRTYCVFRPCIGLYVSEHAVGTPSNTRPLELVDVFFCEPARDDGGGCFVFACSACRKPDTTPKIFDLFDGVTASSHVDNGISALTHDKLSCLSTDERLCLSVLKMVDASFKVCRVRRRAAARALEMQMSPVSSKSVGEHRRLSFC